MNAANLGSSTRTTGILVALIVCAYSALPCLAGPGDSPLEAYNLPYGTELKGTIGAEYTADYYKVIVPATGRLVIRLYDIALQHPLEELNISLFQVWQNSVGTGYPTYWTTVAQSNNDYQTPDVIDVPDLARGIYFVQVNPQQYGTWHGATYKIEADFTVFPPVVTDDVGDQKKYAIPVVNQLPTVCSLSGSKDIDYFECHLPYNTNLTLSLTGIGAGANVDMEVYTAWDVLIGSATRSGNADELLYLKDMVPGQYFIKIFGEGTTPYTFTATQEFAQATDILDDVGNDLAHAMPLLPGNPSVFCLQPYNTDCDIFSVYQPDDGPLTVDVYNMFVWHGNEDLYVQVLDEYGNTIAQSNNARLIPEHIEVDLPRGQYFIGVYAVPYGTFHGAIYTLQVETSASDVGDAFNQAMQIHAIPYGSETYGYPYIGLIDRPNDVDFFQIVLKDAGFIYLKVDRMEYANVDVQLLDADHNLLQTSANTGTEPDVIYVDGLKGGVYFIRVYSHDGTVGQYRLTPTIGTLTSTIGDDIGDSTSRALPLVPYRRVNGFMWSDGTSDYFKFTLEASDHWARVRVSDVHVWDAREDIKLYVYNASGTQIAVSDSGFLEDEIIELKDLAAGTYYARVAPEAYGSMDPVQYTIVVEKETSPQPSAQMHIPVNIQGHPGETIHVPVMLNNTQPDNITSMSVGVQSDPNMLEPLGVQTGGLVLGQWNAQVHYAMTANTMSISMDNFSTVQGGELLDLVLLVKPGASVGSTSALTVIASLLNGAVVPATNGLVTVK